MRVGESCTATTGTLAEIKEKETKHSPPKMKKPKTTSQTQQADTHCKDEEDA